MKFAFITDPLDKLKPYKDSSVAMMREAARRGHEIWAIQREQLAWEGGSVSALAVRIVPQADNAAWYTAHETQTWALQDFDGVMMRQDPPFDMEYVTATWLLERAVASGARIFNDPRAIRDHSEKVSIAEFPQYTAETQIARDAAVINAFIEKHGDVVLKPLDGMGGSSIFRVRGDDPNRNVIIEVLTENGAKTIMAQRFLPAITDGDKRILIIDGKPVPYSLARIPMAGETRGNLAAGGTPEAR
ncbi:MAG TPA: glutathione synthase, partial [Rhodocyclaceae bacterium]|nr:glutathione synthase [Rhodocyclaceae bacterium]